MVHVLDVRAIARQGVLAPGAVAEALEYPPLLHGLVERECGAPRRLIGLGRDTHRHLHRQPQPDYPTSVPFERAVRRAARSGTVEGPAGLEHGIPSRGQRRMRLVADGALTGQRGAGGLFLAAAEVEDDPGAEAERAHRQIACSASSASPKPTSVSDG